MRRMFSLLFAVAVLQCALTAGAEAQSTTCIARNLFFWGDDIPPGWTCGLGEGPFSMLCTGPSGKCPPSGWCPTCNQNGAAAGHPINLTNGNTYIQQQDLRIPGLGNGLMLQRTWNSIWPASQASLQIGIFGPNWRSTYEERVFAGSGSAVNYMAYAKGDGSFWFLGTTDGSTWTLAAPANISATLRKQGTTSWTITFQNGEQRVFSYASGSLTAIIDRNGNATQLTYDSSNRLVTVADPASRHLTFTYGSSYSPTLVTGVSCDVGLSLSYSYDTQGRLVQVTKPDLTTVSFTYNSQSLITAVTDSQGKTLESHTYDSKGRGLTSSRAGGVDAVTVSYP
jgi:YD repeat-containing protein